MPAIRSGSKGFAMCACKLLANNVLTYVALSMHGAFMKRGSCLPAVASYADICLPAIVSYADISVQHDTK